MPLYEYECGACGHRVEIIQKFSDGPPDACRKCGKGPLQRMQSSPAFQFKGTGWYVTDYAGKGKTGDTSAGESKSGDGKSDSAGGDATTKTETKTETKKSDAPASTPAAKES
jgi:putative FmdB family regulatory protein